jgi:hypothetical protein
MSQNPNDNVKKASVFEGVDKAGSGRLKEA